jgi:hypothetical protein
MQFAKRLLMGAGAVVLVAAVLIAAAPKTVQAVVATLIRDVDNPGRAPHVAVNCQANSTIGASGDLGCSPVYTVPASNLLVLQQVEAFCGTPPGNSLANTTFNIYTNGNPVRHNLTLVSEGPDFDTGVDFADNQTVTYYADPGSTIRFDSLTTDSTGSTSCFFQFSGYLISYP